MRCITEPPPPQGFPGSTKLQGWIPAGATEGRGWGQLQWMFGDCSRLGLQKQLGRPKGRALGTAPRAGHLQALCPVWDVPLGVAAL